MKIIKNILEESIIKEIIKDFKKQSKEYAWMDSRLIWATNIYKDSIIGNVSQTTVSDHVHNMIEPVIRSRVKLPYERLAILHCVWHPLSGLNIHNDLRYKFGATIYLNKEWDINWGGLFVYQKKDHYVALPPEYNTCVVNTDKTMHMVTQISPLIRYHRQTIQIWGL